MAFVHTVEISPPFFTNEDHDGDIPPQGVTPVDTCYQAQEQNKRFGGDFSINHIPIITSEHERAAPSSGVVAACSVPVPLFLTVRGPATLRRIANESANKPYVVSNGGDPINSNEGTGNDGGGGGGGGGG